MDSVITVGDGPGAKVIIEDNPPYAYKPYSICLNFPDRQILRVYLTKEELKRIHVELSNFLKTNASS